MSKFDLDLQDGNDPAEGLGVRFYSYGSDPLDKYVVIFRTLDGTEDGSGRLLHPDEALKLRDALSEWLGDKAVGANEVKEDASPYTTSPFDIGHLTIAPPPQRLFFGVPEDVVLDLLTAALKDATATLERNGS